MSWICNEGLSTKSLRESTSYASVRVGLSVRAGPVYAFAESTTSDVPSLRRAMPCESGSLRGTRRTWREDLAAEDSARGLGEDSENSGEDSAVEAWRGLGGLGEDPARTGRRGPWRVHGEDSRRTWPRREDSGLLVDSAPLVSRRVARL